MMLRVFKDQMGNAISIPSYPSRIISLVPSQTELLFDLGLDREVIGVTKFCVHPADWINRKAIVGGTKNFRFDVIDQLNPDLVIANKEENYPEGIKELQKKYPVWLSDIISLDDALDMINTVSEITQREKEGHAIIAKIKDEFNRIHLVQKKRTLYLIWRNPWMSVGGQTFIHGMMEKSGFINVLKNSDRYPELSNKDIQELDPEIVLLSSEPFPFKQEHAEEIKHLLPKADIRFVDGEMFSWYGSRLIKAPDYFNSLRVVLNHD